MLSVTFCNRTCLGAAACTLAQVFHERHAVVGAEINHLDRLDFGLKKDTGAVCPIAPAETDDEQEC